MTRAAVVCATLFSVATFAGCESKSTQDSSTTISHPGIDDTHYAGRSYAGNIANGKLIFNTNCATCHGADGRSGGVGPPLIDESRRQRVEQTIVWIENPNPPMPALYSSPLSVRDVEDVAAFVQTIR